MTLVRAVQVLPVRLTPMLCATMFCGALALVGCSTQPSTTDDLALQAEEDAIDADTPPRIRTLYALARVLAAQGRDAESVYVFRRVLEREPNFLPAHLAIAEAYLRLDQPEQATAALADALRRAPEDPVLLNDIGMTYLVIGDAEQALPYFRRAMAIQDQPPYRANAAAALGMLGREEEAAELYRGLLPPADVEHNLAVLRQARAMDAEVPNGDDTREVIDTPATETQEVPAVH